MSFSIHLSVPPRNQITDPTDDGMSNEDWQNQCGAACIAEVIQYKTGRQIHVDTIKDAILGQDKTGIILNNQMVDFFNGKYPTVFSGNLNAKTIVPISTTPINAKNSLLYTLWNFLVEGNPVVGVFWYNKVDNYDANGQPIFHWRTLKGISDSYVYSNDSIYEMGDINFDVAYERIESYQACQNLSRQLLVCVGNPRYAS